MSHTAQSIFKPFKSDLEQFRSYFKLRMASNVKLVDQVATYLVKYRGKQFRPMLLMTAARTLGAPTEQTYLAAVVVELLHTATLVHDDVVDESEFRRGFSTINKLWRNKIAILMGDYLLSKSLIIATEIGSLPFMNIISNVAKRMAKGELFQIQKARKLNITETEYFQLISDKTASLMSACTELAALTVESTAEQQEILRDYGEYLGIAFQIKDDLLDFESQPGVLGKPVGNDLKDKKITLPLLLALQAATEKEQKNILKSLKNGFKKRDIKDIVQFIRDKDGIDQAQKCAEEYKNKAVNCLKQLPDSEARTVLQNLAEFVITRKK